MRTEWNVNLWFRHKIVLPSDNILLSRREVILSIANLCLLFFYFHIWHINFSNQAVRNDMRSIPCLYSLTHWPKNKTKTNHTTGHYLTDALGFIAVRSVPHKNHFIYTRDTKTSRRPHLLCAGRLRTDFAICHR